MKRGLALGCIFSAGIFLAACQNNSMMMPNVFGPRLTDGQIVNDIMVADKGEVANASIAKKRAVSCKVRHFAEQLYNAHGKCLQKISGFAKRNGIKPEDSYYASEVKSYFDNDKSFLEASPRQDFDKNYVNSEIREHQHALQFLDRAIRDSSNPALTEKLKKARMHVANHLARAQEIKKEMGWY
ncbi:MAG: hypothetical protein A3F18_04935 [Legionellales bacterium RIFCSPHIGHO2_12_FULL_37_14]|nr:MAG: hypothetical protein A3F18_04935 [Legionellales bacterium RIFCSPHIGHO2_12_FULL_37_14]